jgi:hypothetical protein
MKGAQNIDLELQPPPDLAIEVEVSHSAEDAIIVRGRLGVPEVWRFDPIAEVIDFLLRRRDGIYKRSKRGRAFPMVTTTDILDQMKLADQSGAGRWHSQVGQWVRAVIVPKQHGGV